MIALIIIITNDEYQIHNWYAGAWMSDTPHVSTCSGTNRMNVTNEIPKTVYSTVLNFLDLLFMAENLLIYI